MNRFKLVFIAIALVFSTDVFSQHNVDAMKLLEMKQYNLAKIAFLKNILKEPMPYDLFNLGKIYLLQNKIDSANIYFQRLPTDSKNPLAGISQALMLVQAGKTPQALTLLDSKLKEAGASKDINALIEIALARFQAGDTSAWVKPLNMASEIDKKHVKPYVVAGNIYRILGETYPKNAGFFGLASGRFGQALYKDPENAEALTAQAEIFVLGGNNLEAREYLNKVVQKDSNYIPALRSYGELEYTLGKYDKASLFYGKYILLAEYNDKELSKYINILYFNKEYAKANEFINKVLQKDPSNIVMLRLKGYTSYELNKYPEGLEAMKKFFNLRSAADTNKIIASDYKYAGKLYAANGNDSASIIYLRKSIEMDPSDPDLFEDIAKSYEKQKNYIQAVTNYNYLIASKNGNVAPAIYFSIGRDLFFAANNAGEAKDTVMQKIYFQRADSAFKKVIELSPNSQLGYLWHGRVSAALDPESTLGLAKPDYEKALSILELKNDPIKYKSDLIECNKYLGFYYYLQFETAKKAKDPVATEEARNNSLKSWNKITTLDNENDVAKQAIKALK